MLICTDAFGHFTLRVPAGAVLQISYVGYKSMEAVATPDMNGTGDSGNRLTLLLGLGCSLRLESSKSRHSCHQKHSR